MLDLWTVSRDFPIGLGGRYPDARLMNRHLKLEGLAPLAG